VSDPLPSRGELSPARPSAWPHVGAAAFFAILAIVLTWPLASRLTTAIPGGGAGDNVTFLWNFWWMRQALASSADAVFHTSYLFYPTGVDLTLNSHTALGAFVGATVLRQFSIVTANNVVLLAAMTLNGFCAYLLAWRVRRDRAAALLSGVFFAASPYFAAHLRGHFNLIHAWVLPAFWLVFAGALERRSVVRAIAAGLVLVAAAYSDYYYTVYLAALMTTLLAVRWLDLAWRRAPSPRPLSAVDYGLVAGLAIAVGTAAVISITGGTAVNVFGHTISLRSGLNVRTAAWALLIILMWRRWRPSVRVAWCRPSPFAEDARATATAVAVFVIGTLPLIVAAWHIWQRGEYVSQIYFWRSAPEGVDLAGLIAGNPYHPIWGSFVQQLYRLWHIDLVEAISWLGVVPIIWLALTRSHWVSRSDARPFIVVGIVFLIWSLGPYLLVAGVNTGLILPETLLRFVPIVSNARIPGRAFIMVVLAASVFLALVVSAMPPARRRSAAALLGALVLIDLFAVPLPTTRLTTPGIYQELAAMPPGALIEVPLGIRDGFGEEGALDHRVLFYQSVHGKPLVGGFVARVADPMKAPYRDVPFLKALLMLSAGGDLNDPVARAGQADAARYCREHGIRYLMLNTMTAPSALQVWVSGLPGFKFVRMQDGRQLFVVD